MSPAGEVHAVVPEGIDDPDRPSGGNTYDRRLCDGLVELGWSVREHEVAGSWPCPDGEARRGLARAVAGVPDDALLLVDGLVGSAAPEVLVPAARRLRLVVLVHMPLGLHSGPDAGPADGECAVLRSAAAVVTSSGWTRDRLLDAHRLEAGRVHVAVPGVDPVDPADATVGCCGNRPEDGTELLCVAAVIPAKGHDVLLEALAGLRDLRWRCRCVGSVARDPAFVGALRRRAREAHLVDRVVFTGARAGTDLEGDYRSADALVLATRAETYGMVVTEALAHGLPVLVSDVGGVPEALGRTPDGARPGVLVPSGDAVALAGALRRWLTDARLRDGLRRAARQRRDSLPGWPMTASRVAEVLSTVAAA